MKKEKKKRRIKIEGTYIYHSYECCEMKIRCVFIYCEDSYYKILSDIIIG